MGVICPGFVKTEMTNGFKTNSDDGGSRRRRTHSVKSRSRKEIIVFPLRERMFEFMFRVFPWLFDRKCRDTFRAFDIHDRRIREITLERLRLPLIGKFGEEIRRRNRPRASVCELFRHRIRLKWE